MTQICKVFTVDCSLLEHGHRVVWRCLFCLMWEVLLFVARVLTSNLRKVCWTIMKTAMSDAENTGERTSSVLHEKTSAWESFHFHLWEFIFIKKLFVVVVNGRVTVSFIFYSILKQETFSIAHCLLWKENLWWRWWSWEYQKPLWFLHVAFIWTITSQLEIKLNEQRSLGNLNIFQGSTEET